MARRYLGTVLTLLIAGTAGAQQVHVREEMLPNGMKLVLVPRHDRPPSRAGGWRRSARSTSAPGITGISHLFEHMMFKGTQDDRHARLREGRALIDEQDAVRDEMRAEYAMMRGRCGAARFGDIYDPANRTPRYRELKAQDREAWSPSSGTSSRTRST